MRKQDNIGQGFYAVTEEMREVYGMCRRAGVSTQEADKFMAMLYLCHGFYKLPDININTATLSRFGASTARRLWDTIKTEGLKQGGIGKIKSSVETETERLNREVKEAIANGTAKITEIDLKQIDFTKYEPSKIGFDWGKTGLSQMVLMARGDYRGQSASLEISGENIQNIQYGFYQLNDNYSPSIIFNKLKESRKIDLKWTELAREAAGYYKDRITTDEETRRKIYIIPNNFENLITINGELKDKPTAMKQLRCLVLHANFLAGRKQISSVLITSNIRTAKRQAELVYEKNALWIVRNCPPFNTNPQVQNMKKMYTKGRGEDAYKILAKDTPYLVFYFLKYGWQEYLNMILKNYSNQIQGLANSIETNPTGFNHVQGKIPTIDLGINSNPILSQIEFRKTLDLFIKTQLWLNNTTLPQGQGGELDCHHIVFINGN